ncbi:MAG: hypothetical protein FWG33_03785, partial [Oscillospiraceae bacterium]|nr:hypothetical protein [Oscillospiraceae bacterium]
MKKRILAVFISISIVLSILESAPVATERTDFAELTESLFSMPAEEDSGTNKSKYAVCGFCDVRCIDAKHIRCYCGEWDCDLIGHCSVCSLLDCKIGHCKICFQPNCSVEHTRCIGCMATDCEIEHWLCHERNDPDCTKVRMVGDVNGDCKIDIFDVLEILRCIIKTDDWRDTEPNSCMYKSALIMGDEPSRDDVHEIFLHTVKFPNVISKGFIPGVSSTPNLLRAEISQNLTEINYYNNVELLPDTRYYLDFKNPGSVAYRNSDDSVFTCISSPESSSTAMHTGSITVREVIPVNTLVLVQPANPALKTVFEIAGYSISETFIRNSPRIPNSDNRKDVTYFTVFDALEILKYLIKMPSVLGSSKCAVEAALLT